MRNKEAAIVNAKDYNTYLYNDMVNCLMKVVDMKTIEKSILQNRIRTVEGFVGELKWMHHNSVIFNGSMNYI